ncbi:MAG: hypothetical protein HY914_05700 [Desulfomonile tiedjei]|nr:hypothetical protein [Desulfomonile tiedjei]
MFNPDQPIQSTRDDALGRAGFARSVAMTIRRYKPTSSLVLALNGNWGCGKTSILNMMTGYIEKLSRKSPPEARPIVCRFNPWNFSDQNQLISQFFAHLSTVLNRSDLGNQVKDFGEKLKKYAKFLRPLELIPGVKSAAELLKQVLESGGDALETFGKERSEDLTTLKEELNGLLEGQSRRIIIIIDDVDRLNNTEIRQVFQLVKSLADFKNIVYVLAFDKNVVLNALSKVQGDIGERYLEKVVNVPLDIPDPDPSKLKEFLRKALKDITKDKWDARAWEEIYTDHLDIFFRNFRDVLRFLNTFRFGWGLMKDDVNLRDFIYLTAIQIRFPHLYDEIRKNFETLVELRIRTWNISTAFRDEKRELQANQAIKENWDSRIPELSEIAKDTIRDALKTLFPELAAAYGGTEVGRHERVNWRAEKRICHPSFFNRYFKLSLEPTDFGQEELEEILACASDPEQLSRRLGELHGKGRLRIFWLEIEAVCENGSLSEDQIRSLVRILFTSGNLAEEAQRSSLFWALINGLNSFEARKRLLHEIVENPEADIGQVVCLLSDLQINRPGDAWQDQHPPESFLRRMSIDNFSLNGAQRLMAQRLFRIAENRNLANHPYLGEILTYWSEWPERETLEACIDLLMGQDDTLVETVACFFTKDLHPGSSQPIVSTGLKNLWSMLNVGQYEERIRAVYNSEAFSEYPEWKRLAVGHVVQSLERSQGTAEN